MSHSPAGVPLVALTGVTVRLRDFHLLHDTTWYIHHGEQWVVLGPNGSGKSALVRALAGDAPTSRGTRRVADGLRVEVVSFESQQNLYSRERDLDHARYYSGHPDEVLTLRDYLLPGPGQAPATRALPAEPSQSLERYISLFDLEDILDRPFRFLSAGEMRKAVIVGALSRAPDLLVLDEPYDGLDGISRERLAGQIETIIAGGVQIVLVTHRREEIPAGATHALTVSDLQVQRQGPIGEVLTEDHLEALYRWYRRTPPDDDPTPAGAAEPEAASRREVRAGTTGTSSPGARFRRSTTRDATSSFIHPENEAPMIAFRNVTIGDDSAPLVRDLSWTVRTGEHWIVTGPNGSGKTTLVNLISGEDQRGYAVDLSLFGSRRGTGESLWEIRERIGVVTPRLQLAYAGTATVLETVISGFYGSVGLYRRPSTAQVTAARETLGMLGITLSEDRLISRVSYGQRRLVLIARALVSSPEVFLLDEPCQGLDPGNRALIIDAVDRLCREGRSTVIYITHHDDEIPRSIEQRLELLGNGEYRVRTSVQR
jgi:molybdate transport system ATP-binding protein